MGLIEDVEKKIAADDLESALTMITQSLELKPQGMAFYFRGYIDPLMTKCLVARELRNVCFSRSIKTLESSYFVEDGMLRAGSYCFALQQCLLGILRS
jgi:hypothetical protein